jgi:hypothetical protein
MQHGLALTSTIFWDITPCIPLTSSRRFGGTYCLHLQGGRISPARNQHESRWQAEQRTTRRYIREDSTLHNHRCENLKSYITMSPYHLLSRWFLARLILRPWRWRRYVPPKRRLTLNRLHDVISKKIEIFITTGVRTSIPTALRCLFSLSLCLNMSHAVFEHPRRPASRPVSPPGLDIHTLCFPICKRTERCTSNAT